MTPVDIDKLKELLATATKRPWVKFHSIYGDGVIAIMKGKRPPEGERWKEIIAWTGFDASDVPKRYRHENAELICAAVNSLPALIAKAERVDALEEALTEAASTFDQFAAALREHDPAAMAQEIVAAELAASEARNALSPKESE